MAAAADGGLRDSAAATPLEWGLLTVVLVGYAIALPLDALWLRPGFVIYDEQSMVDCVQAWLEGGTLSFKMGIGGPQRYLIGLLVRAGAPGLAAFHLPVILAVLAEPLLLLAWLRPRLGERAALWAALAHLLSTVTFARGRSMLGPGPCPALFLLAALWVDRNRHAWQAAIWGLMMGLGLLLYEGWALVCLALLPYAVGVWRRRPGWWACAGGGLAVSALVVLASQSDWAAWMLTRASVSFSGAGVGTRLAENLRGLLWPGQHRLLFSAAPGMPVPSPWTWPLLLAGAIGALRRWPALAWLCLGAAPALVAAGSGQEPHRLFLLWFFLSALSGAGAANLAARRWGLAACLALAAAGAGAEIHAWWEVPATTVDLNYGLSHNLAECARFLSAEAPPQGWEVIDGLGGAPDESFRYLLDAAGVPRKPGGVPVALVYWDDRPALDGLPGRIQPISSGGIRPIYLYFPPPAVAQALRRVRARLAPLHRAQLDERAPTLRGLARADLDDPTCRDLWSRTVLWEIWLENSRTSGEWDPQTAHRGLSEPLFNGRCYDLAADIVAGSDPASAAALQAQALRVDPRRAKLPQIMRAETF